MEQIKFQVVLWKYISWIFKPERLSHSNWDTISLCLVLEVSICGLNVKLLHTQGEKFLLNLQVVNLFKIFSFFLFGRYLSCVSLQFFCFPLGPMCSNYQIVFVKSLSFLVFIFVSALQVVIVVNLQSIRKEKFFLCNKRVKEYRFLHPAA